MLDIFCEFKGVENLTEKSEYGHLKEHFYFHQVSPDSLLGFNHGRTEKNTLDIFCVIPSRFELAVIFLDEVDSVLGQKILLIQVWLGLPKRSNPLYKEEFRINLEKSVFFLRRRITRIWISRGKNDLRIVST